MAVIECPRCGAPVPGDDTHRCGDTHSSPSTGPGSRDPSPRTQQAVRLVAAQLGCDHDEALRRLRERAGALQYRLHDYALLVIDGMIRFDAGASDGSGRPAGG